MTLLKEDKDEIKRLNEAKVVQGQIDRIIQQELEYMFLNEGLIDNFKAAWEKTKGVAQQGWDAIKGSLAGGYKAIQAAIKAVLSKIQSVYPALQAEYRDIQQAVKESGGSVDISGLQPALMGRRSER